jgi:ADP-ribosylglycohydrolase
LSELLKDCIAFTGDVDTVATIALAAASCSEEITQDLPAHLIENLAIFRNSSQRLPAREALR